MRISTLVKLATVFFVLFSVVSIIATIINNVDLSKERDIDKTYQEVVQLGKDIDFLTDVLISSARGYAQFGDASYLTAYKQAAPAKEKKFADIVRKMYEKGVTTDEITQASQAFNYTDTLWMMDEKAFNYASAGDFETAKDILFGAEYDAVRLQMFESMEGFYNAISERKVKHLEASLQQTRTTSIIALTAQLLIVIIGVVSMVLISIRIRPIKELVAASIEIAKGNLDFKGKAHTKDEVGDLYHCFDEIATSIKTLTQELDIMSQEHTRGEIDYAIDLTKFSGSYRVAADSINRINKEQTDSVYNFVSIIASIGDGNFDVEIPLYPGKKAIFTEAITKFLQSIRAVNEAIGGQVNAMLLGHLSDRSVTAQFKGDWATLLEGLNSVVDAVTAPIDEAIDVLAEVSKGNLTVQMHGAYNGDLALIKNSLNATITALYKHTEVNHKLASIITNADSGIIIKDRDGTITNWNRGAEKILGFTEAEMLGKTVTVRAEDIESQQDECNRLANGEHFHRHDLPRLHKNGTEVRCSVAFTPIYDTQGNVTGSVSIFSDISEKVKQEKALQAAYDKIGEQHETILSSINYASKIQQNLLPRDEVFKTAFADYAVKWSPKDIVGGDIYWIKNFRRGSVLCVCDCTGHGTPGALLTMLVVSAFENIVNEENCLDPADIMWKLDKRLTAVLNVNNEAKSNSILNFSDGCDLAIICIANDKTILLSAGNTHVFVCDGTEVNSIKGQRLRIGDDKLDSKDAVRVVTIPPNPNNKFYIGSDGLFDQIGEKTGIPFGYRTFKQLLLEHHAQPQDVTTTMIWDAFEDYKGAESRRDDVELVAFTL